MLVVGHFFSGMCVYVNYEGRKGKEEARNKKNSMSDQENLLLKDGNTLTTLS